MYDAKEYGAAYDAHNAAWRVFDVVRIGYRAGKVGDAEFIAARAAYAAATARYDAAFAKAADNGYMGGKA